VESATAQPRRAGSRALALVWTAVAALLAVAGLAASPGPATRLPDRDGRVDVRTPQPGRLLSVSVHWDAPAGHDGWLVLEPGPSAPPPSVASEAFWRRRVLPGWNHLLWDVSTFPAGGPVALRLAQGAPSSWAIATPRTAEHYGPAHLSSVRGLLAALGLALALAVARLVGLLRSRPRPGWWTVGLTAITALAVVLRVRTLTAQSLWFDEVLTAIGSQSFAWVLYTPQIFGHPPLGYLAAWAAGADAGAEGWMRAPFVIVGAATVFAIGWLGRALLGPATGLIAALALALSPFHVDLSQTARPYSFLVFLTVVSMLALHDALRSERVSAWLLFSATAALALYSHYLGASVLLLEAMGALLAVGWRRWGGAGVSPARRGPALGAMAISFAGVVVLALPWVSVLGRLPGARLGEGDLPVVALRRLVWEAFVPQFLGTGAAHVVGLALVGLGLYALRRRPEVAVAMALWLTLPLGLIWIAQPGHFVAGRHLAFVLPVIMLLLAHGVVAVAVALSRMGAAMGLASAWPARSLATAAVVAAVLAWGIPTAEGLRVYYHGRLGFDWRIVADVLDAVVPEGDAVAATVGAGYPLRYYWREGVDVLDAAAAARLEERPPGGRLWIVTHEGWDRPPQLDRWLQTHAIVVAAVPSSWSQPGVRIHRVRER
jgi:hypothetical protein